MSRGLGRIEQAIAREIERAHMPDVTGEPFTVLVSSWELLSKVYIDYTKGRMEAA